MFHTSLLGVAICCWMAITASTGTAAPVTVAGEDRPFRTVLRDGTGDVWKVDIRTSHWTRVGDLPAADVRRAVIRHRDRVVTIRTRFADLRRIGSQSYWVGIDARDDDFFYEVTSTPRKRAGRHAMYEEPGGARIGCAGLSHRIDYANDMVRVRVPRSCLGDPPWVRVNIGNLLVVGDRPFRRHYADNPHDNGAYSNVGTKRIYRN